MIEVMEFVEQEERPGSEYECYQVEPGEMYPAMLDHIEAVLAGEDPYENVMARSAGDVRLYHSQAQRLDSQAWGLARVPRDDFDDAADVEDLMLRGEALEIARLWFTALMRQAIRYRPLGLHILAGDGSWRL